MTYIISDRIKVTKARADEALETLNGMDGVEAEQVSTDEFDIPPSAVLRVEVDLEVLDE